MLKFDDIVKTCYNSSTSFYMEEVTGLIFSLTTGWIFTLVYISHLFVNKHGSHIYTYENNCWLTFLVNNITFIIYFVKIMVT